MKAFLLAAGRGERLRPLTDRVPKCLVPVGGRPLLGIWLERLREAGAEAVLVNTHHLAGQVEEFVAGFPAGGMDIRLFHEQELLGSAGTVAANRSFVEGEQDFLVVYADNVTDLDLGDVLRFHRDKRSEFTMVLFETPEPRECGVVVLDADDRVVEFQEKPAQPRSRWANGGIYVAGPSLFSVLSAAQGQTPFDFGYHVLPRLAGRAFGYRFSGMFCDTGTPERLERARREWAGRTCS